MQIQVLAPDGVKWLNKDRRRFPDDGWCLSVDTHPDRQEIELREIDDPQLYLKFHDLRLDSVDGEQARASMKEFVQQFGALGGHGTKYLGDGVVGEIPRYWHDEVTLLRDVMDLWNLAKKRRLTELKQRLVSDGENHWVFERLDETGATPTVLTRERYVRRFEIFSDGSQLRDVAFEAVTEMVNYSIEKYLQPMILPSRDNQGEIIWRHEPNSLIGEIWYQVANAIVGGNPPRSCKYCKRVFLPPRPNALYCGEPCRKRIYERKRSRK